MLTLRKDTTVINWWPHTVRIFEGEVDTARFNKAIVPLVSLRKFLKRIFSPAVDFFTILKSDPETISIHPK